MAVRHREIVAGTANALGVATFTIQGPPTQVVLTGSLGIPSAPASAIAVVTIGGIVWASWSGNATIGPVQQFASEPISVVVTGLTPNTTYNLVFIGMAEDEQVAQIIWPSALATSIVTAAATGMILIQRIALTVAGNFSFQGIIPSYDSLSLRVICGVTGGVGTETHAIIRFNGDTGNNYDSELILGSTPTGMTLGENIAASYGELVAVPGGGAAANSMAVISVEIPGYSNATFHKGYSAIGSRANNTTAGTDSMKNSQGGGRWRNTAVINQIDLGLLIGSFAIGSVASLYGLPAT